MKIYSILNWGFGGKKLKFVFRGRFGLQISVGSLIWGLLVFWMKKHQAKNSWSWEILIDLTGNKFLRFQNFSLVSKLRFFSLLKFILNLQFLANKILISAFNF